MVWYQRSCHSHSSELFSSGKDHGVLVCGHSFTCRHLKVNRERERDPLVIQYYSLLLLSMMMMMMISFVIFIIRLSLSLLPVALYLGRRMMMMRLFVVVVSIGGGGEGVTLLSTCGHFGIDNSSIVASSSTAMIFISSISFILRCRQ